MSFDSLEVAGEGEAKTHAMTPRGPQSRGESLAFRRRRQGSIDVTAIIVDRYGDMISFGSANASYHFYVYSSEIPTHLPILLLVKV